MMLIIKRFLISMSEIFLDLLIPLDLCGIMGVHVSIKRMICLLIANFRCWLQNGFDMKTLAIYI